MTAIVTNALEREEQQLDLQLQSYHLLVGSSEKRMSTKRMILLQDIPQMSDACLDLGDLELELAMAEEAFRKNTNQVVVPSSSSSSSSYTQDEQQAPSCLHEQVPLLPVNKGNETTTQSKRKVEGEQPRILCCWILPFILIIAAVLLFVIVRLVG